MEKYSFDRDIRVICVTARSFPDGIKEAHQRLHAMLPATKGRNFFGISYPESPGVIIYRAAVEESYPGEGQKMGAEIFTIKKGDYVSKTLKDWHKNEAIVSQTFRELLSDPRIDENGYCLEVYPNDDDMICMVKLDPAKARKAEA